LQPDADDGSEQRKHDENAMPPARGSEPSDPADALRLVRLALRELFTDAGWGGSHPATLGVGADSDSWVARSVRTLLATHEPGLLR
jgi:hypothetical protein